MPARTFTLVRLSGPDGAHQDPLGECTLHATGDEIADDDRVEVTVGDVGVWSSTWGELTELIDGPPVAGFAIAARPDPRGCAGG